jgi:multicomponent Na+:H+ antiporter subunit E
VSEPTLETGHPVRAALVRGTGFIAFWIVLIGADASQLAVGLVTAAAATWLSLRLLPPGAMVARPAALPALALRFVWLSVVAGWDVARRALDPRMPLRPGFVTYPVRFPPGPARIVFSTFTSLLPGTVPAGDDGAALLYHCLDVEQPIASQLAAEEAMLSRTLRDA